MKNKPQDDLKKILDAVTDPITIYTTIIPIIDPKILLYLTQCENVHVRRAIACAPAATWGVLSKLIDDPDADVREFICGHSKCPDKILEKFTEDKSYQVVAAARSTQLKRKIRRQKRAVAVALTKAINRLNKHR